MVPINGVIEFLTTSVDDANMHSYNMHVIILVLDVGVPVCYGSVDIQCIISWLRHSQ